MTRLAFALLLATFIAACSKTYKEAQFMGSWVSSRTNTPVHIQAGGVWEIRNNQGQVLQSGGWEIKGDAFVWVIHHNGQSTIDSNPIVRLQHNTFELRENDGSMTRFRRVLN